MEPKFNTSFIPKQSLQTAAKGPTVREYVSRRSTRGPMFYVTFLIFFITCLTSVGIFVYAQVLEKSIDEKIASLERARDEFEPALMKELTRLDVRMSTARDLLGKHVAVSSLFRLLATETLRTIRFTTLQYKVTEAQGVSRINATLTGLAPDFKTIALQGDELKKNEYLTQAAISNVNVDGDGNATFSIELGIDPRLIHFSETLDLRKSAGTPLKLAPPAATSTKDAVQATSSASTTSPQQ